MNIAQHMYALTANIEYFDFAINCVPNALKSKTSRLIV